MQRLIGITGKAGSGKSTTANWLKSHHHFMEQSFAEPIREMLVTMLGESTWEIALETKEEPISSIGKSPRELMQTLGTDWGRQMVHPDIWVNSAEEVLDLHLDRGASVVFSDVRFENEADFIRRQGGCIWHLSRTGAGTPHSHESECGIAVRLDLGDVTLNNDSPKPLFYRSISKLLED